MVGPFGQPIPKITHPHSAIHCALSLPSRSLLSSLPLTLARAPPRPTHLSSLSSSSCVVCGRPPPLDRCPTSPPFHCRQHSRRWPPDGHEQPRRAHALFSAPKPAYFKLSLRPFKPPPPLTTTPRPLISLLTTIPKWFRRPSTTEAAGINSGTAGALFPDLAVSATVLAHFAALRRPPPPPTATLDSPLVSLSCWKSLDVDWGPRSLRPASPVLPRESPIFGRFCAVSVPAAVRPPPATSRRS